MSATLEKSIKENVTGIFIILSHIYAFSVFQKAYNSQNVLEMCVVLFLITCFCCHLLLKKISEQLKY